MNGFRGLNTPHPVRCIYGHQIRAEDVVSGASNGDINAPSVIPIGIVADDLGQACQVMGRGIYLPVTIAGIIECSNYESPLTRAPR